MGCVSSKHLKKTLKRELAEVNNGGDFPKNGDFPNHVVSLTSTTYGFLNLDHKDSIFLPPKINLVEEEEEKMKKKDESFVSKPRPLPKLEPEVINAWELMSDLEDEIPISKKKSSPRLNKEVRSPFKSLIVSQANSPKMAKKLVGKENRGGGQSNQNQCYTTPKGRVVKPWKFSTNSNDKLRKAGSLESPRRSNSALSSSSSLSRRRSLGPLFDPELIESFEKELLSEEEEQIKKMVSPKKYSNNLNNRSKISTLQLEKYELNCPPGGEECVVIYTTTLRGIRKTFEDCNVVRSVVESHHIRVIERDVSMDSGFKEEVRKLMGTKEVKVPLVFVKGRLIGGAEEVTKLEEEGSLEGLLDGISKAVFGCGGCGGIRFVMCLDCSGSCKVLDEDHKSMVRCGECNENGLIQCPICCSST